MADSATNQRWFFGQDHDAHWYLVPVEKRNEWEAWLNLDEDDERSWQEPDFVSRVDSPHRITFTDPKDIVVKTNVRT